MTSHCSAITVPSKAALLNQREKNSREEFHRVIFVLKAKGKGIMPRGQHETKGVDLAVQNSGE